MTDDAAMGVVIHDGTLTTAVRCGGKLHDPIRQQFANEQECVAAILVECANHRHARPRLFLFAGSDAAVVRDRIHELDRDLPLVVEIVDGRSSALTLAGAGHEFYNRWSELLYRFYERAAERRLFVPPAYHDQLAAFEEEGDKDGKTFFLSPSDVKKKLGYFPALAIAAILAAIETPSGGPGKSGSEWDPYDPTHDA